MLQKLFRFIKKAFLIGVITGVLVALGIYISDNMVVNSTKKNIYQSTKKIPYNKVGLLLGTGKYLRSGRLNLYYKYRIDAAVQLYQAGKISVVLVSGDNSRETYDEPTDIKQDLIKKGIPANRIYLDYAGFRTLDSVVRCKKIFGQKSITVISQQFHNQRAIYIADHNQIKAIGYNAKDVHKKYSLKVRIREKFARVKMMLDLIFGVEPKFLGKQIVIK